MRMPAQRDLTGMKFGSLTVLRADGRVFWGRDMVAWLCRCDCGAEIRVPQRRLTSKVKGHQMHACEDCRAVPCEICGRPIPLATNAKACSQECQAERRRRYDLQYYHEVQSLDPAYREKARAYKRRKWAAMTPEERLAESRARAASEDRDVVNARARAAHQRRMEDPEYAERKRQRRLAWAEKNQDEMRAYNRNYKRRKRAESAEIEMLRAMDEMKGLADDE